MEGQRRLILKKKNNEFSSFSWTGRNWEVLLGQHSKIPKSLKSQTTISKDFIGRNDNGIMQYTPDFKKCLLSFVGRLCKIYFPTFCYMLSPPLYQPHRELLSPEQSNSLLQFGIYFAQWDSCFLKHLGEILICFEEEFWILTSSFLFSFASCLWFFRRNFLNMYFLEVVCL